MGDAAMPSGAIPATAGGEAVVDGASTAATAAGAPTPEAPTDVAPATTAAGGQQTAIPRAGSVDDNAEFAAYLDYLARYQTLGLPTRPFDPTGRILVSVTGSNGLPVAGLPVSITGDDQSVVTLRTSVAGRVVFLPAEYGHVSASYHIAAGDAQGDAVPGTDAALTLSTPGGASAGMPVDVLFLLDVTGSMGDEIAQLKTTIASIADRLHALPQQPDIRFGMTLFRDQGDTFLNRTFDFTSDLASFQQALADVVADGGGDTPEAVDEALAAALHDPSWRDPATTVQMIFLVGDAAPHVERQLDQPYTASIKAAAARGIVVHSIAASNTDDPAEHAFREIAQGTGGRFVFLSYGAAGAAIGPNSDIASTDYEVLSLDDLVVRLVGEALAHLTGTTFTEPTSTTVPPTNPPGQ